MSIFLLGISSILVALGDEVPKQRGAQLGVDLSSCEKLVGKQLSSIGSDGTWSNPLFTTENGRISVRSSNAGLKRNTSEDRESYQFQSRSETGGFRQEKLEISKNGDKLTLRHIFDNETNIQVSKSQASLRDSRQISSKPIGQEVVYSSSGDEGCRVTQKGNIVKHSSGNFTHVWMDSKYCEAARNVLNKFEQSTIEKCSSILSELQSMYVRRDAELSKEQKTLREPGSKVLGVGGIPDMLGGIKAISACSFSGSEIGEPGSLGSGLTTLEQPTNNKKDGKR